jgi:hypothetical protein
LTDSVFTVAPTQVEVATLSSVVNLPLGALLLDSTTGKGEFEELCWQCLHHLPLGLRLGQIKTVEYADAEGEHRRFEFDSRGFLANGTEPVAQIMVSLYRKPGAPADEIYLELEQAQVWFPDLRGQHIGKAIVENVRKLGLILGVKAITALAMYDGRWVWPMLDFRFGDYLPEEASRQKFIKAFRAYCRRHQVLPPTTAELASWDAPQIARFRSDVTVKVYLGHPTDGKRHRQAVALGRAFLLSRHPFFVTYPLSQVKALT